MKSNADFRITHSIRCRTGIAVAALIVAGCANPPAAPVQTGSATSAPSQATKSPAAAPAVAYSTPSPRTLSDWKRNAAERIQSANRSLVFSGAPPNPLHAVVVVEMTVGADGQVRRADLLRVPGHAKQLGGVALKTLNAASPLPAPPKGLVVQGTMKTTETWLFREDGQFQIRSLALAQAGG